MSGTEGTRGDWRGCRLAARNADFWHATRDFASETLCGIALDGAGMTEDHATAEMTMCPRCRAAHKG